MKDKLIFVSLLRMIAKADLSWGTYEIKREGPTKGQKRKALVCKDGSTIFISNKLSQQDVRSKYDTLIISRVGDQKVCHEPGITAEEAFE
jgi:hypothetical protein